VPVLPTIEAGGGVDGNPQKHAYQHGGRTSYVRDLFQWPGIAQMVNFAHIKQHYYEHAFYWSNRDCTTRTNH
jgi:hypothetical protein